MSLITLLVVRSTHSSGCFYFPCVSRRVADKALKDFVRDHWDEHWDPGHPEPPKAMRESHIQAWFEGAEYEYEIIEYLELLRR